MSIGLGTLEDIDDSITFIGGPATGKSTLIQRLNGQDFTSLAYLPTHGTPKTNIPMRVTLGENSFEVFVTLIDTKGQRLLDSLPDYERTILRGKRAVYIVFASDDKESLELVKPCIKALAEANPEGVRVVIVENKVDLRNENKNGVLPKDESKKFIQEVSREVFREFGDGHDIFFFPLSAKSDNTHQLQNMLFPPIFLPREKIALLKGYLNPKDS